MYWLNKGYWPLNLGFTVSQKEFAKWYKKLAPGEEVPALASENGARLWIFNNPPNGLYRTYIITLSSQWTNWPKPELAGIVAHEAVHVCQVLWEAIGEESPGREAEAYLVQGIVRDILEKLG